MKYLIFLFVISQCSVAFADETDSIPIVSLDSAGNSAVKVIPSSVYQKTMGDAFTSINASVLPVAEANSAQSSANPKWTLQAIGVGLGVTGQVGAGPIVSIAATARARLIFTNCANAVYPD